MRRTKFGLRPTVFAKLSMILILTGIIVNALIIFGMRYVALPGAEPKGSLDHNIELYVRSLATEVGDPPTAAKMYEVAKRTGFDVRVTSLTGQTLMQTSHDLPPIPPEAIGKLGYQHSAFRPGYGVRPFAIFDTGSAQVGIYAPVSPFLTGKMRIIIVVILLTSFTFAIGNLAAQRVLKPFNALSEGVRAVSEGRFEVTMPEKGDDEFRVLARGFNAMTERIVSMMKSKQQLLLDVSHELRSPISRMMMTVGMMPKDEDRERLERNLKEMESMISGVLEMSRLESAERPLQLTDVDLTKVVCRIADLFDPRAATISLTLPNVPVVIKADEIQVQVLLRNLVENAVKYSDASSRPIEVAVEVRGGDAVIEVKDRGVGIPAEDLPNVTEPFYRVDRSRSKATGGFGLGLSLCQRIMKSHSGRLEIASPGLGAGTTATAAFPLDS